MRTATRTIITELRRTGAAGVVTPVVFDWSAASHASILDDLEFELRVKTNRREVPGGDNVVEQVMAATWQPFEFTGEWVDMWAGAGFAWNTYLAFSQLVGRTNLVRLQLDQHSFVGLLTNLKIKYRTVDRIKYTCTISPHQNEAVGSFRGTVPVPVETRSPDQWQQDVAEQAQDLSDQLESALNIPVGTEDVLDARATQLQMNRELTGVAALTTNASLQSNATQQLLQAAGAFRRVSGQALTIAANAGQLRSDLAVAFADVLQTLKYDAWRCTTYVSALQTAGLARKAELDMRARAAKHPKAIYRPQAGEPWERIALKFYGTADAWRTIYDANPTVASLVLDGTEVLTIPERQS